MFDNRRKSAQPDAGVKLSDSDNTKPVTNLSRKKASVDLAAEGIELVVRFFGVRGQVKVHGFEHLVEERAAVFHG